MIFSSLIYPLRCGLGGPCGGAKDKKQESAERTSTPLFSSGIPDRAAIHWRAQRQRLPESCRNTAIKIPRRSRGYFIDGQSPLLLAARAQRVGTVCQPRSCYLPPVNGPSLLRCFPSSSAPPSGLHPAGA